jgi:hypothetical protein
MGRRAGVLTQASCGDQLAPGLVPAIIAKTLADNLEPGEVRFIDASLFDHFRADPRARWAVFRRIWRVEGRSGSGSGHAPRA